MGQDEQGRDGSPEVRAARDDLAGGREWQARDRPAQHGARTYDVEALELLGEVHSAMRDLPAAGAAWFGTRRRGADVEAAVEAWREQHGDHFGSMWSSLPRPVREHEGNVRVDALRRRVEQEGIATGGGGDGSPEDSADGDGGNGGGPDAAVIISMGLAVLFVACAVIGFVTLVRWLVPGV